MEKEITGYDRLLDNARSILEKKSNEAIINGNKFKGYYGFSPEQYSKEDLILILNVLFNEAETLRITMLENEKNISKINEMKEKTNVYILQKDYQFPVKIGGILDTLEAGSKFKKDTYGYVHTSGVRFPTIFVENNPEWFLQESEQYTKSDLKLKTI